MSREKQIEEMAEYIFGNAITHDTQFKEDCRSIARDLYNAGYRKQSVGDANIATTTGEWISVDERLPEENEVVLIWVGNVQVARIHKGITEEEREKMKSGELPNPIGICWSLSTGCVKMRRSETYRSCDVFGNNLVPYLWKATSGPMEWFGQNVSHWMPLPEAPKMKGGAE